MSRNFWLGIVMVLCTIPSIIPRPLMAEKTVVIDSTMDRISMNSNGPVSLCGGLVSYQSRARGTQLAWQVPPC